MRNEGTDSKYEKFKFTNIYEIYNIYIVADSLEEAINLHRIYDNETIKKIECITSIQNKSCITATRKSYENRRFNDR